jgi:hypothetical protein
MNTAGDFSVTDYPGDTLLALPFSGAMTKKQVDYVYQQLRDAIAHAVAH